ncbi:MAG TPA: TetR/AcrR family transcriptional regulator [Novosphingobium sp.]
MELAEKVRRGRPTRDQVEQRDRALLDHALELFVERGYDNTTIRDLAAAAGTTRRTVYARYADKRELFEATIEHALRHVASPVPDLDLESGEDLETLLIEVARFRIANVMTPTGLRFQRFLHTESYRFPEIVHAAYGRISNPALDYVAELLERHNAMGVTDIEEPRAAARALMNMVVGVPVRTVLLGRILGPEEIEERIRFSVGLFLRGVLRR